MNDLQSEVEAIRRDFPVLHQEVHGRPLAYLDNAATTQVPTPVLDAVMRHYRTDNANVHRGIHTLSERSTAKYEQARRTVQRFVNAAAAEEIVFTGGTTDAVNLVAHAWGERVGTGDTVVVTALEHHANFVPWQQLCARTGARFEVAPLGSDGTVDFEALQRILETRKVGMVAVAHVSNVLGCANPVKRICEAAHAHRAHVLVDAAQSIRHEHVDVQELGCDFLCFSGHKVLGPTGIGVLYGRAELLAELPPARFGGEMVDKVSAVRTTFEAPPLRFEAGTPNYVGAIALAAALDYVDEVGRERIAAYERLLVGRAEEALAAIPGLRMLGSPQPRVGCVSFTVEDVHPFDLAALMDQQGFALRSGNQCAQPLLHEVCGVQNVCRLSPAFYNTLDEIERCAEALASTIGLLRRARG